jgi:anti-anti-sigma factor
MRISESRSSQGTTLFLSGAIDDTSSSQLQNELFRVARISTNITLDFADVVSISKSGMTALQAGQRLIAGKRGKFTIQNANPAVKYELHNEGLSRLLMF